MENSLINARRRIVFFPLFLFVVSFLQLNTVNAQKASNEKSDCTESVIGFMDNYVLFTCFRGPDGGTMCTVEQEQCDCALKNFTGAKGCIDGNGKKIAGSLSNPNDDGRRSAASSRGDGTDIPVIHFLAGESNCLIRSELNSYISRQNNGSLTNVNEGAKVDDKSLFWDFKAVESGNQQKGFYILTHEDNPRALVADGTTLSLQPYSRLDQKKREKSQWNFFINDKDSDGVTNYLLRPQNNPDNLVLAANSGNNKLELVSRNASNKSDPLVAKGGDVKVTPQERKGINWNCQCVF